MNKTVFFVPLSLVGLFFTVYILLASTTNFLSVEPGYAIGKFLDGVKELVEAISESLLML